jgi:hypothetical protein
VGRGIGKMGKGIGKVGRRVSRFLCVGGRKEKLRRNEIRKPAGPQ